MHSLEKRLATLEKSSGLPAVDVRDMTDAQLWAIIKKAHGAETPDRSTATAEEIDAFLTNVINKRLERRSSGPTS